MSRQVVYPQFMDGAHGLRKYESCANQQAADKVKVHGDFLSRRTGREGSKQGVCRGGEGTASAR
jgi:hypothetical protein